MSCSVWQIIPSTAQTPWQMICFVCPNSWTASAWSLIYSFACYSKYCPRKLFQGPQTWLSPLREGLSSFLNDLWCYWICDVEEKKKKRQPLLCIFPSAHPWDSRLFLSSFSLAPLLLPPVRGPAPARKTKAWTFSQGPWEETGQGYCDGFAPCCPFDDCWEKRDGAGNAPPLLTPAHSFGWRSQGRWCKYMWKRLARHCLPTMKPLWMI